VSDRLQQWQRRVQPEVEWRNAYGTTETTITTALFNPRRAKTVAEVPVVPAGRPVANTEMLVLDAHMRLVPIGIAGELWVGGAGVSRGYIGDPAGTAERFAPHPFSRIPGQRLYRTGDRARWRPDGNLEILGRADRQIKLRGFRIEPGEIECCLAQHPAVRDCAVVYREDETGNGRVVAHVVTAGHVSAEGLRSFLGARLPAYMVPSNFLFPDKLPRKSAGKVDYRALTAVVAEPSP
jgi:acyl-CoA synthetase (AMP-forming)/AMP-acid ligase II